MSVVCVGLSHRTAPAEVRERHAFPSSKISEALIALLDYEKVREAAILSTCNRLEIYADVDDFELGVAQLKHFLVNFRHSDVPYDIEPYLYTLLGADAAHHLLRVATGLDSMLIGEAEILGQVKDAYCRSQSAHSFGKTLHRLFREALNAGKAARSQTEIGGAGVSLASAAVAAAKQSLGTFREKTILLIGAGKMGAKAATRLKAEGVERLIVANRTRERARELVARLGIGETLEFRRLFGALTAVDLVITSTETSDFVLTRERIARAMRARPLRPLCIVDIALPRDVDPEAASVPGVEIVDIDKIGATIDLTLQHRRDSIPMVESIIADHLAIFKRWYDSREAFPVISALSKRVEAIRQAEIERLLLRCPGLGDRERRVITGLSLRITSKLMHPAFAKIRDSQNAAAAIQCMVIDELFDLGVCQEGDSFPSEGMPSRSRFAETPQ